MDHPVNLWEILRFEIYQHRSNIINKFISGHKRNILFKSSTAVYKYNTMAFMYINCAKQIATSLEDAEKVALFGNEWN